MIELRPSERCQCRRPRGSGRWYLKREACTACGLLIVRSPVELARLREAEERELRTERRVFASVNGNGAAPAAVGVWD